MSSSEFQEMIQAEQLYDEETTLINDDTPEEPISKEERSLEMLTTRPRPISSCTEGDEPVDPTSNWSWPRSKPIASPLNEEVNLVGATADESMAVEALRQLRGMFDMNGEGTGYVDDLLLCPCCGLHFRSEPELQRHVVFCQQPSHELYVCNICNESFARKSDLVNHTACHQVDKAHTCQVCGGNYRKKADLQNHMVLHQTSRPYRCNECGIDFQRPSSLTNHMKIHSYHPGRAMLSGTDTFSKFNSQQSINDTDSHNSVQLSIDHIDESVDDPSFLIVPELISTDTETLSNESMTANLKPSNVAELCGPVYDCLNTDSAGLGGNNPASNTMETSNGHLDYINLNALCSNPSMDDEISVGLFEYLEVPTVSATVDIETTNLSDNSARQNILCSTTTNQFLNSDSEISLNANNFTNAPVKVETLPYYMLDESHLQLQEEVFGNIEIDTLNLKPVVNTHTIISDSKPGHLCNYCGKVFGRANALASHVRVHKGKWDEVHHCRNCEESFYDAASLTQHQQSCVDNGKPLVTLKCEKRLKSFDCSPGISTQKSKEKHCCTSCDKKFTTKQKLFRHMWIHRKKQFVCEVCGVSLGHQEGLEEHRRALHPGETPYVCQECGRGFASRQGLWEHGRLHGNNNSTLYRCPHCNKTFSSRQGYLIHTRTHTGERPYGCRFCMKAFRDGGTLRKHERIHTGERPHVCPLCYRAFNQKVVLREHVRWVHAANRDELESDVDHLFICEVCNQLLGDREELCAHIVKHSDDIAKAAKAQQKQDDAASFLPTPIKVKTLRGVKKSKVSKEPKISKKPKVPKESTVLPVPPSIVPVVTAKQSLPVTQNGTLHSTNRRTVRSRRFTPSKKAKVPVVHTCQMCSESFVKRKQLIQHVLIHI